MTLIAFAGPSLAPRDRSDFPAVEWRPPAEAGDLLRIDPEPGLTVCLIDGYFDHRPAVRHKEILLLLSEGVQLYGASSIGALRAAEMESFGMIGVGSIFKAYSDGRIEGDDEVALIHASAKSEWRPLSVPQVDVRATLCRAVRARVLEVLEARAMLAVSASIHYVERSWSLILEATPLSAGRRDEVRSWLKAGAISQKRLDALACLRTALSEPPTTFPAPALVPTIYLAALAQERGISLEGRI